MSGRQAKRLSGTRAQDRRVFSLMVHGAEFGAGEELVVNPECFPEIKVNDLVEISQPERDHHRLVLQVMSLNAIRGKLQVSILKDVAAQFGLDPLYPVGVQKIDERDVTVDFLEVTFRDQFVSRADIWRVKVAMLGKCVYIGKHVAVLGVRSQVEMLLASNQNVMCGVVGADTKVIVRSRSSRLIWLVQMSTEMWEFAPDGELYYEKMLNRLLKVLIAKWTENLVSHSVTIITFSRSFYDKNQFPDGYDPTSPPFRDPIRQGFGPGCCFVDSAHGYGPTVHIDPTSGRYFEDFYKVLVMNFTGPDWSQLVGILKREFVQYHEQHRWRTPDDFLPAEYEVCEVHREATDNRTPDEDQPRESDASDKGDRGTYVKWKALPYGIPSRAADGNILEAINVTLNILDKHFMDRDLNRTGQSIVMITAGSSVFRVDERLADVTKQRMMDNGVGMDMISLATPPLHVVPLFICRSSFHSKPPSPSLGERSIARTSFRNTVRSPSAVLLRPSTSDASTPKAAEEMIAGAIEHPSRTFYIVPHWVNITFLEFDCSCTTQTSLANSQGPRQPSRRPASHMIYSCACQAKTNRSFSPLPPFRMFDMTAPTEKLIFPVALANTMKKHTTQAEDLAIRPDYLQSSESDKEILLRRISNLSDTISTASLAPGDQWRLCKSPDFEITRSPRLESLSMAGVSASIVAREALEEYDAGVFAPTKWRRSAIDDDGCHAAVSFSLHDESDFASTSLTGDMLSLITSQTNNRWKSASSHVALGSSSLVNSILSPRNTIPQSRSTSTVVHGSGVLPEGRPMRRDVSALSLTSFGTETEPKEMTSANSRSTAYRLLGSRKSPPLAPNTQGSHVPSLPTDIVRRNVSKSADLLDSHERLVTCEGQSSETNNLTAVDEPSTPLSRSLKLHDRSVRSPPLSASSIAALLPSPMELSGSYKKSFLTGNGMMPGLLKAASDQVGSSTLALPNAAEIPHGIAFRPSFHEVNPFKYSAETLESTTARLSSDRRRWSHLFPAVDNHSRGFSSLGNETNQKHLGPNWKSLTSPAILPLTTDYHPSPKELYSNYTESFYTLTLPSTDGDLFPKYKNHDELLIEMICQRLASDFQLVAQESGSDSDFYRNRMLYGITNFGRGGEPKNSSGNTTTYYLSMGHRIHQIIYDADLQAIEVKRYVDRSSQGEHNEPVVYKYSLWVDRTQSFHPLQQNFYQFPMPEDNWNSLDHLLCGYHDEMSDMIKYRRIRFAVLPPASVKKGFRADEEEYAQRFTKFVDYLQTRVASEHGTQEKIRIKVLLDPLPSPNLHQQVGTLSYKMSCESMASYTRLKSEDPRNESLMMHVEDTMQVHKSYHFDVRWLACSGIIVDDFISTIRRKAKQAGLELRRIPEYTSVSFLQIHPLIAPIFLPMPLEIMQSCEREKSLVSALVNRLDFVFDDEKLADSRGIGYGLGIGKEEKVSVAGGLSMRTQRRARSKEESEALLRLKWCRRGYKQYTHRQAPVFLRLIRNGIVWIPSYDYDQVSTPQQVNDLFREICALIQANAELEERAVPCRGGIPG